MTAGAIVRGATPEDRAQIADLYALCFTGPGRPYDRMHWRQLHHAPARPGFRDEYARIAALDGRIVAHVQVIPYLMHYGASTLTVGGIGNVCTHPDCRHRGYAAAMMRDAIDYMGEIGCDISLLNGIAGYYPQYGYAPAWPYRHLDVYPHDTAHLTTPLTVRDLTPDDFPAMLALYARQWRHRPGARVRDATYLAWALDWFDSRKVAVVDTMDQLRGYMVDFWIPGAVCEVVAEDADATAALLLASAAAATHAYPDADDGTQAFRWFIPHDAPAVRHARRLCSVEVMQRHRHNGGWMGRIINLESTLARLLPELEARLAASALAGWSGSLRLETDLGAAALEIAEGRIQLVERAASPLAAALRQSDLIELVFAYATPEEVAARKGVDLSAEVAGLLSALFPHRVCDIAGVDWY